MKRRIWAVLLTICLVVTLLPTTAVAADNVASGSCGENATWNFDSNNGTLTISGTGRMSDYPLEGETKADPRPWKDYLDSITKIEVTEGITYIGERAFHFNSRIGSDARPNPNEITISLPETLTEIGKEAFVFANITSIDVPAAVTDIYASAFYECKNLNTITGMEGVKTIGDWAFKMCAFSDFPELGKSESIGGGAFLDCIKLTAISLPVVTSIGSQAFSGCTSLESVDMPSVEDIGNSAFVKCSALSSVIGLDHASHIAASAFTDCTSLKKVVFSSDAEIEANVLKGCSALEEVNYNNANVIVHSFEKYENLKKVSGLGNATSSSNWNRMFANCPTLEMVDFGGASMFIGTYMFVNCVALKTVSGIENVTKISEGAFKTCDSLTALDLSKCSNITSVEKDAFKGTRTRNITIYFNNQTSSDVAKSETDAYDSSKVAFAITNGGTFSNDTEFEADKLATPVKDGYDFKGWWTKDGTDTKDWGVELETPTAGGTYYAKWHKSAELSTNIGEKVFIAGGDWVEFTFTTTANDDAGMMVTGGSDFGVLYEDKIAALEYKAGDQWIDMKGQNFGGSTGFPMADATSTFRVKFTDDAAGTYSFKAAMTTVDGNQKLCEIDVPFTVRAKKSAELTTDIAEKTFVAGGDWVEFTFTTTANDDAGTMVTGGSDFGVRYEDKIAALEYKAGDQWIDMKGQNFGGSTGFPMTDATSTFRVKFTDDAAGTYSFKAAMTTVDGNQKLCEIDVPFTVNMQTQAAPVNAPTLKDRTYTSITLNTVEPNANGAAAQYSKDGGQTWQDSAEFTDLTSNTTYTFAMRYAEKAPYAASDASATAEFSTLRYSSGSGSSSGSSSSNSYAVSAPSTKNGDVTISPKTAKKGDTVTITVTPDKGYELDTITVKDASGNTVKLTDKGNGKYTFTMPASKVTVSADFTEIQAASTFADVPADAYYAKAVEWAVKNGITNGKNNGLFGSNDPCTRGQIVTFLWRAAGSPAPKGTATVPADVLPGSYCYNAVAWALENGITNGMADGTFGVNNTCTRGQSVTFLYRALGTAPSTVNGFTDVAADSFCADAVAWAVENGVTNGTSATTFSPADGCTRAQIVTFLYRAYQGK